MLRLTRWRIVDRLRQRKREAAGPGRRIHTGHGETTAVHDDATDRTATIERLSDPAGIDLEKIWNEEWRQTTLATAMAAIRRRVRPEQFQIFDLYVVKQLPAVQVARIVGVSIARVYLAKHRVAALLKSEVRRIETTHGV
jgi:RNA polymerase sigma-70 factor (ECF subfamily)